jgi:hypothetical protein
VPNERRREPRYPSDLDTVCRPALTPHSEGWRAVVLNISRGGVALVVPRRFEPGVLLTLDLDCPAEALHRAMLARVVRARPHEDGTWVVGCVFTSELDDAELRAFSADRVRPRRPDARAWMRFTCDAPAFCREVGGEEVAVRVVNVCPGGLGLLAPLCWDSGTLLSLRLPDLDGQPGACARLRVVQGGAGPDGQWIVGCEPAAQLAEDDLLSLLGQLA